MARDFVTAIIMAAGMGRRMNRPVPKQFIHLRNKPIFIYTLEIFLDHPHVDAVVLVVPPAYLKKAEQLVKMFIREPVYAVVPGGERRQDSVFNGLAHLPQETGIILIQDGVRPFVTPNHITEVIEEAARHGAAVLGIPVSNTIKRGFSGWVEETLNRDTLWEIQTPQGFNRKVLADAYEAAIRENITFTDDAALVERAGHRVRLVHGDSLNIKITSPEDLILAEAILNRREA